MATNRSSCWATALVLCVAICAKADAQPIDTRCVADGGIALCSEPANVAGPASAAVDIDMWTYNVCDFAGTFASREAAWTRVLGGKPIFDADIVPVSTAFEQIVNNACLVGVTDSGWGYTIPPNILCWSGGPVTRNRSSIRDFRKLSFNGLKPGPTGCNVAWADVVYAGKWRGVACPRTYNTRTKPNGDLECWKVPPECTAGGKVGNPITLLDGCKAQREADYRSRAPDGVEVERFYNSGGYFRFDVAPERASDVWRTTWDRRILVPPAPSSVLAYAQRADGSLQVFAPGGRELHNNQGGASAMLQRVTDASGNAMGWRLTTADSDFESYDASGRLLAIALRNGRGYALTYTAEGRLASVVDAFGGTVTFTYEAGGRLAGFVAPGNRVYVYAYDAMGRLVSVTYPDSAVRTYHYEDANFLHALTGITDENGVRFATWRYDSSGRAASSQHAGGTESVSLQYGSFSPTANVGATSTVDAFGTTRTYDYQVVGGVSRIRLVRDPGGAAVSTFDANGNLATYRDANGNQTTYTHDLARNLELSRTEGYGTALARTISTQWHSVYRLPTKVIAPSGVAAGGEVTDYVYDEQGNLLQKTVAAGGRMRQWNMTYSSLGQTLTVDGSRTDVPDITTYTYYDRADACVACRGNVKSTTNAAGHRTTFDAYDVGGQPLRIIDPNGVVTTLSYDVRGRVRSRTVNAGGPLAETTGFDYDRAGQLLATTMPDGSVIRYQYDAAHRLTEIADGLGNVVQYTLDAMGNRIKEDVFDPADRLLRTQRRIYDALNRLYNDIGAAGQTAVYSYDAKGNLKTSADPLNRTTALKYDALNRLLSSTDAAGGVTRYGYDAMDRLTSVQDPLNLTTTYTYDGLGNLTQLASPDAGTTTYAHDAAGNTIVSTDARGVTTAIVHDALNRQTLATFAGGSVEFEYDNIGTGGAFAKGRLTGIADPSGVSTYLYDASGRVLRKTQTLGSGATARTFAVSYQYAAGRMTGIVYPSGRSLSYAFDPQGRVSAIAVAGATVLSGVTYAPFGPTQGWSWANGQLYRRTFDRDGRAATITTGPDTGAFGNGRWMFGYDSLDRLTSASLPQGDTLAYTYDANGNRKQETRAGATTAYGYFAMSNRLQQTSGAVVKGFAYDAAGNLTSNGSATFTYDGRGRLAQVSNGYRYAVNGLGQRVSKSGPGGIVYFVYDERGRLIGEYDTSGAVRQELVYLDDIPVASVRPSASGGADVYPIYSDHLNTPRLITNAANRTVWEWPLDTFGAVAANENPSGLGVFSFNLRFPGQYYDAETGLHYNYFRDYDPGVGRYVQSDPIGLRGGVNTYAYVDGSPISKFDTFGLDETIWRPGPGRQWRDGPRNGNWCGVHWSGGSVPSLNGGRDGVMGPIDSLDRCCMTHDRCYGKCSGILERRAREACEKNGCDRVFVACMKGLDDNCGLWPELPRVGTEGDSQVYRDDAIRVFEERIRKWRSL